MLQSVKRINFLYSQYDALLINKVSNDSIKIINVYFHSLILAEALSSFFIIKGYKAPRKLIKLTQ